MKYQGQISDPWLAVWARETHLSGFENLSGPNDLNRHDNITGLYDLNSLFGL